MTKQQKLGACFGGAFGVVALALGWFLYSAYADRQVALEGDPDENTKGLNDAQAENMKYYAQHDPFPSENAIAVINSNKEAYAKWKDEAVKRASQGDLPDAPPGLSGNTFKGNYLDVCLSKMRQLPGNVKGRICADDKWFGFERYMGSEGATPTQEDVPKLYKQFVTVTNVVDMLVQCGVLQVVSVNLDPRTGGNDEDAARGSSQRDRGRKGNAGPDKGAAANEPTRYDYELEFSARAAAIVKVLNALARSPRFYVVSEFGFRHEESESLKDRLDRQASGGGETSSRRSRRNREKKEGDEGRGAVTDPKTDLPMLVHMKLSVYDFGTGGALADADKAEGTREPAKKEGE